MASHDSERPADGGSTDSIRTLLATIRNLPDDQRRARLRELATDPDTLAEVERLLEASPPASHVDEPAVGDTLGPWRLVERLADGGMGVVFVAERADGLYEQRVAIKLLHGASDASVARRLAEERKLLAHLRHPAIARLYDGGTTPAGQPYLVMELVDGVAIDRYCRQAALGLHARIALFLRVCEAVQAAHQQLIVHCDIKPSNVLVREDGQPVLLDFGIARVLGTDAGQTVDFCTPAYASPEILRRERVGTASDVFGLGVLLTELLAGRRPPRAADRPLDPVPPPSVLAAAGGVPWRRRLRGDLDAIAARACAIDPAQRYGSVAELADDLARWADRRPVRARNGGALYRARRALRRHWRGAAVAAVLVATTAGFVWRLQAERDRARREAETAERVSALLVSAFEHADPKRRGRAGEATARDVLDAGARELDRMRLEDPALRARLLEKIGLAYHHLGQPQRAEPLLRQAVARYLDPHEPQPLAAARVLAQLAVLLADAKQRDAAVAAARQAVALCERHGATPLQLADALNSLGLALVEQDNDQARRALERALALRRAAGEPSLEVAATLHNLGQLHRFAGNAVASEAYYRQALAQKRALRMTDDGSYWSSLTGLAMALDQQGRLSEAVALRREGLRLAARLYPDGKHLATAHNELASSLHDLGQWEEAERHYREAERLSLAMAGGAPSVEVATAINNRASLDEDRGALAAAEEGYRRSLAIRRAVLGEDAVPVLRARFNLARLLLRRQRVDEAGALLVPAWTQWSARQPPDHPSTVPFRLIRAEWLLASGRLAQAQEEAEALLRDDKQPARRRAAMLELRGRIAEARGDRAAGLDWRRRALDLLVADHGPAHVETAKHRLGYAAALHAAGQDAQAREQLAQAIPVLAPRLAPDSPLLAQMRALEARLREDGRVARR